MLPNILRKEKIHSAFNMSNEIFDLIINATPKDVRRVVYSTDKREVVNYIFNVAKHLCVGKFSEQKIIIISKRLESLK